MKVGAASHPEVLQRRDVLVNGIYGAVADIRDRLLPDAEPLPRFVSLGLDFLSDCLSASWE